MALEPPEDFSPRMRDCVRPSLGELWELWERREARRLDRERSRRWRQVVEEVRRRGDGGVCRSSGHGELAWFLKGGDALGPGSRMALRPSPRSGRVMAAGVDTWSPCWYAEPGSRVARAMSSLATRRTGRVCLVPQRVGGYRIGWFPEWGLVFGEGRPCGDALCGVEALMREQLRLEGWLGDLGVPVVVGNRGGLRRMDVAVDLLMDSGVEGLGFLECVGAASLGVGKVATYRSGRRVESVLLKSRSGRSQGRVYDKGRESGRVSVGCWVRLEGQWRFQQGSRPLVEEVSSEVLCMRFRRRFEPLWQAAGGFGVGGLGVVVERVVRAVELGQLRESRARALIGFLVFGAFGVDFVAKRTGYELERECRELGLSLSVVDGRELRVDVATVLEECMASGVWSAR